MWIFVHCWIFWIRCFTMTNCLWISYNFYVLLFLNSSRYVHNKKEWMKLHWIIFPSKYSERLQCSKLFSISNVTCTGMKPALSGENTAALYHCRSIVSYYVNNCISWQRPKNIWFSSAKRNWLCYLSCSIVTSWRTVCLDAKVQRRIHMSYWMEKSK